MFIQGESIRDAASMTNSSTYILELPKSGLLSSLQLRLNGTRDATWLGTVETWRMIERITKIEVIGNGATVIKSLTGLQAQAFHHFDQGGLPPSRWRNYATEFVEDVVLLNFGRMFGDKEIGLDLSKWNSVELKITNDADATILDSMAVNVLGYYWRDLSGGFRGYMRTEDWRNWTTVQAERKYLELPTEHKIRRLVLQAIPDRDGTTLLNDTNFTNLMYDIELSLKTGQTRVYKGGLFDLAIRDYYRHGPIVFGMQPYFQADKAFKTGVGWHIGYAAGGGARDGAATTTVPTIGSAETSSTLNPETYVGDHPMNLMVIGMAPHECVTYPFDYDPSPDTWLDANAEKVVKLDILTRDAAASADGTNHVILDRFVQI